MKRIAMVLGLAVVLVATAFVTTGETQNAAVVINDITCGLLDGNGGFVITNDSHAVVTGSNNGNGLLWCKASNVANSTGKAVHWDFSNTGLLCSTPAGTTNRWNETVSASGEAMLRCHVPQ